MLDPYYFSDEEITQIAQALEKGNVCHVNEFTGEVLELPFDLNQTYSPEEIRTQYGSILQKIDNEEESFIAIEPMTNDELKQVMEDFLEFTNDIPLRNKIMQIIQERPGHFSFSSLLKNEENAFDQWLEYLTKRYEEWVRDHMNTEDDWGNSDVDVPADDEEPQPTEGQGPIVTQSYSNNVLIEDKPFVTYKHLFDLTEKVAIVSGASKGIGKSIAQALAQFGARVVICSRKQSAVDEVASEIQQNGFEATGIACHVGEEDQLEFLVNETISIYGGIDILINNAATNPFFGPIAESNTNLFDKIMEVNLKAPYLLSNLVYPIMKKRGGGSIINIASVEGLRPSQGLGLYSVSKAALIMLSKTQAKEWGADNIRVNTICPGLVKTKFSAALWQNESILDKIEKSIPSGRMALPDEMAGLAVFLASNAGSYCTGGTYTADGGYMVAG